MKKKFKKKDGLELLAPAKDLKCAIAAIQSGADAIYIGATNFGARKNVPNSFDDIKKVVNYAHKFYAKVFVTVNTILTDEEIIEAVSMIKELDKIEVDAFIIQDMGILEYFKEFEPDSKITFHASTQCDSATPEKVKFLSEKGIDRVILARELSLEEIYKIKKDTDAELEVFIQGALCVSYSGQCYMSELIGGRSANRGECAQPCRKKYSLIDEDGNEIAKDSYLLSLRDFNASAHIKTLAELGVKSFKIEGRLKDVNYVKNVVGYYRKLIDNLGLKKESSGQVELGFEPDLEKTFNRGFTDYFLRERKKCFSFDSPKSKGEYLGKVTKVGKDYFEIKLKGRKISPQDGLCFSTPQGLVGCLVNKVVQNRIFPNKMRSIKSGVELYRNQDVEFEKTLKNAKSSRKIKTNIEFYENKIVAIDEDKNTTQITYEFEEYSNDADKMRSNIIKQLKKSGESDFSVKNVKFGFKKSEDVPFIPISTLNELRRELLEKLMIERLNNYQGFEKKPLKENISFY